MFVKILIPTFGVLLLALDWGLAEHVRAQSTVCSVVRIEIKQELTVERQAFDAHMRIVNGLDSTSLEDIEINVWFLDSEDNSVLASSDPDHSDARFFITLDSMSGVSGIDGSGTINPGAQADVHWLIIPAPGAGGQSATGELYQVGATLSYTFGGESETVRVSPDFIQVRPMPMLQLDYFLPAEVIADDPLTSEEEDPEPFDLGVRVTNSGYGPAHDLAIDSAQPEIVDNTQGLAIEFELLNTQVDDQPAVNSLLADFGDLEAGGASIAIWKMVTSLYGHFISFEADYFHSDELGGELTSLIDRVDTHTLIRTVRNDLAGRDAIRDFLARDGGTVRLYESDGVDTEVTDVSGSADLELFDSEPGAEFYRLSFADTAGPIYAVLPDPTGGEGVVSSVWRSDGKRIPEINFWQSRSKATGEWEALVHVFDTNSTGRYEIIADVPLQPNRPPQLDEIGDQELIAGDVLEIGFSATDPDDDPLAFSIFPLPPGAQLDDSGNGQAQFVWPTDGDDEGLHELTVMASDGEDQASQTFQVSVLEDPTGSLVVRADDLIEVYKGETVEAFDIRLDSAPAADVWVPIVSSDEARALVEGEGVHFTAENWDVPQTVSVHAIDSEFYQGDLDFEILIGPSESADEHYDQLVHAPLDAINRDTESARLLAAPGTGLATAGEGTVARFEARLNGPPTAPVTVRLESSHPELGAPDPAVLTIEPEEWDKPAEVLVRGQPVDEEEAGESLYLIAAVLSQSSDENFSDVEMQPIEVIHRAGNTWGIEVGTVVLPDTEVTSTWVTVEFGQEFRQVPIVVWIADDGEPDPAAVRIRNVTAAGFEALQVEPPGSHGSTRETTMHFLAVEPGVHPLPDGGVLEAGLVATDKAQTGASFGGPPRSDWEELDFEGSFAVPPIFLAGIQSLENETGELPLEGSRPWLTIATDDVRSTGAQVALERSLVSDGSVDVPENVGYLAVSPGEREFATSIGFTTWDGQEQEEPAGAWRDGCEPFGWWELAPEGAVLVAHQLTRVNRQGGGWLRLCTDEDGRFGLVFDQDVERHPVRGIHDEDVRALWFSRPFYTRLLGED